VKVEVNCKYCGNSIPENRKFCNRTCSGKYSCGNSRKALAEKTSSDPEWHSRRSTALWADAEYARKVKDKTFDNPTWKRKYQSKENQQYAIDGWKAKFKGDPSFRDAMIANALKIGFTTQFSDPESKMSLLIKSAEWLEKNSIRSVSQNRDPSSLYGTMRGRWTEYNDTKFRSSWEARFAKDLDSLFVEWQYEPRTFIIQGRRYTPDFFLPCFDLWIELKPAVRVTLELLQKITLFPHNIILVSEANWQEVLSNFTVKV